MKDEPKEIKTTLSVGEILKATRTEKNLQLKDITEKLCIGKRHLKLLEEGGDHLVCDVYTLGFLKIYAKYLGLDADKLTKQFQEEASSSPQFDLKFPTPSPKRGLPSYRILGISILALCVLAVGLAKFTLSPPFSQDTTPLALENSPDNHVLRAEAPLPAPEASQTWTPPSEVYREAETSQSSIPQESSFLSEAQETFSTSPDSSPPLNSEMVILKTTEESWIQVKDKDGKVILSQVFKPGEIYEFESPEDLVLTTGNGRGTHLIYGDKTMKISERHKPKQNIPLDPAKWIEQASEISY